jgi:hypothetical protein
MPFWLKMPPPGVFFLPASLPPTLRRKGKISETFERKVLNPELVRRARENVRDLRAQVSEPKLVEELGKRESVNEHF